jgi:ABC-type transporter MlaC component
MEKVMSEPTPEERLKWYEEFDASIREAFATRIQKYESQLASIKQRLMEGEDPRAVADSIVLLRTGPCAEWICMMNPGNGQYQEYCVSDGTFDDESSCTPGGGT